jgi:transposase
MTHTRKLFLARGFDNDEYKRVHHRCQAEYLRTRLRCVKTFAEGHDVDVLPAMVGKSITTCRKYVQLYIKGGFASLMQADTRKQPRFLSDVQEQEFKTLLLTTRPCDHGIEGNIWTAERMKTFISARYGVTYKSGIYDLLERLGLSHQRAHADYGNASPEAQYAYLQELRHVLSAADETHRVVSFDEFSIGAIPTPYYGWAVKNTRPVVKTDEKKESEPTACSPSSSATLHFTSTQPNKPNQKMSPAFLLR